MTKQETLQERSARLNQAALKDTKDYATESYYKGFSMNKPKEQTPVVPKITLEHGKTYVTFRGEQVLHQNNTFTTSELQSLTKMQSKVITALEAEILELKETAAYLGGNYNSRVQELRKKIYNEITTKKKRLVKLVELQSRMKRSK